MRNTNSFNNPFMLGFDELENLLLRISKGSENFPPYNIEQISETHLRLSLAVAGYKEEDLDISMEENQLTIKGAQNTDPNRHFLHKGIAGRSFIKSFVLADGLLISEAFLENGLLHIDFQKPNKEKRIQKIAINTPKTNKCILSHKGETENE